MDPLAAFILSGLIAMGILASLLIVKCIDMGSRIRITYDPI